MDDSDPIGLTVAICSRDRRSSLRRVLDSLETQVADVSWEVLVVDNGSRAGTGAAVEATAREFRVPLRVVCEARRGLSFARNHALRTARGANVLFIDDDVTCRPGLLAAHVRALADPVVVGTGGRIIPQLPPDVAQWIRQDLATTLGGPTANYDLGDEPCEIGFGTGVPGPFGANMALRAARALDVGGFDENLGWGKRSIPGEETELFQRMRGRDENAKTVYVPAATVDHWIDPSRLTRAYFRRWSRGHGRSTVLIRPPEDLYARVANITRQTRRLLRWRARTLDPRRSRAEILRKCAKAEGKLLQLLGL